MFKKSFYSNIGANEPIVAGTIKLGSTKGRGSSTRMFIYCKRRSPAPSLCINQFITITNATTTKPLAPILTSIQTGNTKLTIFYTAPSNFIESNITDYQYSIDNGNTFTNMGTTTSPYTINGLTNNTTYTIIIRAVNVAGSGINSNSLQGIPCVWETFGNGLTRSSAAQVRALDIDNNYNIYVTGLFNNAGDIPANSVAKWNGNIQSPFWSELNYGVYAGGSSVEVDPTNNSNVYFGGGFTSAGDPSIIVNRIAKWDGNQWASLGSGLGTSGSVRSIATNNNIVYAGGSFIDFLAQWNGISWQPLGDGVNSEVDVLVFKNNELYVGGSFTSAGGVPNTSGIAKWDGSQWSSLGNGLNSATVLCIAFDPTNPNNIYVGGAISDAGLVTVNNITKWDGTSWSNLGVGVNDVVRGICVDSNGNVYAGGSFTNLSDGSLPLNYIAKWDGTSWSELDGGVRGEIEQTFVYSLKVDSLDNIYVGGRFNVAGTITANCIAKYNTL